MEAIILDVEGTLVDCVGQTLESWHETLGVFGYSFSVEKLHAFSGMDSDRMLDALVPAAGTKLKAEIIDQQGRRYRERFLPSVRGFPGVRSLFERIKQDGRRIGLATSCQPDELALYQRLLDIEGLVDAHACGADAQHGKPYPDLYRLALRRVGVEPRRAVAVGDTPFDAIAARAAGIERIVGTLTGGFSASMLEGAGCTCVIAEPQALLSRLETSASSH